MEPAKKALLFFIILAVAACASSRFSKCPKADGKFPKKGSYCKAYFECRAWIPFEKQCFLGEHFNPIKGRCVVAEQYPCLEEPRRKECPQDNGRFLIPGTECKMFYDCCNGIPKEKQCPPGTLFDPSSAKCEWAHLYVCLEKTSSSIQEILSTKPSTSLDFRSSPTLIDLLTTKIVSTQSEVIMTHVSDLLLTSAISSAETEWSSPQYYSTIDYNTQSSTGPWKSSSVVSSVETDSSPPEFYFTSDSDTQSSTGVFDASSLMSSAETEKSSVEYYTTPDYYTESSTRSWESTSEVSSVETDSNLSKLYSTSESNTQSSTGTFDISSLVNSQETEKSSVEYYTTADWTKQSSTETWETSSVISSEEIDSTLPEFSFSTDLNTQFSTGQWGSTPAIISEETYPSSAEYSTSHSSTDNWEKSSKESSSEYFSTSSSFTQFSTEIDEVSKATVENWGTATPPETDLWCPEPFGYFPHPTDKHKFIGCVDGIPSVLTCPSNLVYRHQIRQCDYE